MPFYLSTFEATTLIAVPSARAFEFETQRGEGHQRHRQPEAERPKTRTKAAKRVRRCQAWPIQPPRDTVNGFANTRGTGLTYRRHCCTSRGIEDATVERRASTAAI